MTGRQACIQPLFCCKWCCKRRDKRQGHRKQKADGAARHQYIDLCFGGCQMSYYCALWRFICIETVLDAETVLVRRSAPAFGVVSLLYIDTGLFLYDWVL